MDIVVIPAYKPDEALIKITDQLWAYARGQKNILSLGVRDVGKKMPLRSRFGNRITRTVFKAWFLKL